MNTKNLFIAVLSGTIACLSMISCNNEVPNTSSSSDEALSRSSQTEEVQSVSFIYKGKTYESDYFMVNDSTIGYMNPEVEELAESFEQNPNLYIFLYPNGMTEYFNDAQEFHKDIKRVMQTVDSLSQIKIPQSRSHSHSGLPSGNVMMQADPVYPDYHYAELVLYDDVAFLDRCELLAIEKPFSSVQIPHLKDACNMNDKVSSMIAYSIKCNALFECFEDDNYKSHCMSFVVRNGERYEYSFTPGTGTVEVKQNGKNYGEAWFNDLHNCHVVGTKRSNWHDRITSVKITIQSFAY